MNVEVPVTILTVDDRYENTVKLELPRQCPYCKTAFKDSPVDGYAFENSRVSKVVTIRLTTILASTAATIVPIAYLLSASYQRRNFLRYFLCKKNSRRILNVESLYHTLNLITPENTFTHFFIKSFRCDSKFFSHLCLRQPFFSNFTF